MGGRRSVKLLSVGSNSWASAHREPRAAVLELGSMPIYYLPLFSAFCDE